MELAGLVGRRVALRHRLGTEDGRPLYTDAVGELADDGPEAVLVHTRRGQVRVARDAVVAVREIPPPVPRRPSWAAVARLENVCADAWPAPLERPLGQWRLRAAGGFTARANSALAVGDPGRPVADALAEVVGFADEHGVEPRAQVPRDSPWHRNLAAHGWVLDERHAAGAEVSVLVTELSELTGLAEPSGGLRLAVEENPGEDWWRLAGDAPVTAAQRHVLTAPGLAHVGFGVASDAADAVIGAVRLAVLDEHLHVARLAVAPEHRRRGVAVALTGAAARWAAARSARWCVLQVADHNTAALGLYRRLGFRPHHRYVYLRPPG
ncbi:N-acetyltransferase [Pseudonocardia acaciae]|uniref:N-acetyltransferase n=1 Tax=Pseudonocardia acaciae TaxID=551276 RepID=UPI000AE60692